MSLTESAQVITIEAGADLSSDQHKFVVIASDGQVDLVGSAGADADGVLMNKPSAAGRDALVQFGGVAKVIVGSGGLTAGNKVQSDASGLAIVASSSDHVLGKVLKTYAAGDVASILLVSKHILA